MSKPDDKQATISLEDFVDDDDDLEWSKSSGRLESNEEYLFLPEPYEPTVELPSALPSIVTEGSGVAYFMIPRTADLPEHLVERASPRLELAASAQVFDDAADDENWPPSDEIIVDSLRVYRTQVDEALQLRRATNLLARERDPRSELYASLGRLPEQMPMLIEGLMRERGVSVVFGAFDEFKTTLVLDMMAHVAMGVPWQGRQVKPRHVIWYALEGKDEIPVRLQALEAKLQSHGAAWGDDRAPITVLDRIPEDYCEWRAQISEITSRWEDVYEARRKLGELPLCTKETTTNGKIRSYENPSYWPPIETLETPAVVVIDTLSLALGGEDEKGPRAVGFINDCLDLLKGRPDLAPPEQVEEFDEWQKANPTLNAFIDKPVSAHVIIIHHQTKTGVEFAGHRAIAANTHGLYRVHRYGKITDADRPYAGQIKPQRVKGIPRPAPIRFEVEIVPIKGTKQTAAILKSGTKEIPQKLIPVVDALRELDENESITNDDMNKCIDTVTNNRTSRSRYKKQLTKFGVIEPVEDDNGEFMFYRFHDTDQNTGPSVAT